MELQLGLALSPVLITTPIPITRGSLLDLNSSSSYSDDDQSDYSIGSSISVHESYDQSSYDDNGSCCVILKNKKRRFEEAFEADSTDTLRRRTLPLLTWNKQPKEEDDHSDGTKTCSLTFVKNGEETEGMVGWAPIKSYRKKHYGQGQATVENGGPGGGSNCLYVKVQMEGVLITRKIDLSLHQCYERLISTLLFMFGRGHESVDGYTLTYLDKEGGWLLAAGVPWRIFIESVQRIKLLRKED